MAKTGLLEISSLLIKVFFFSNNLTIQNKGKLTKQWLIEMLSFKALLSVTWFHFLVHSILAPSGFSLYVCVFVFSPLPLIFAPSTQQTNTLINPVTPDRDFDYKPALLLDWRWESWQTESSICPSPKSICTATEWPASIKPIDSSLLVD